MGPIIEPPLAAPDQETIILSQMSPHFTGVFVNSNHTMDPFVPVPEQSNPQVVNTNNKEIEELESMIKGSRRAVVEARKLCPMATNRGLSRYEMFFEGGFYHIDKPVCHYQLNQFSLNIPSELRQLHSPTTQPTLPLLMVKIGSLLFDFVTRIPRGKTES
ncbi:hypothetical protein PIB30_043357 [Stylosanthes scabra]|uniref:Uncharacterized protein n=1 Tax=Stylosanthes scabra TaxID=79078 RepID=A0ABU6WDW8_9FABA|nr:hypothetical protein [Stylosanthes scabra]